MSTLASPVPAAAAGAAAPDAAQFIGKTEPFTWLLIRGNVLQMVTLGIYRFWLATDIRRFLWSNTEVNGESFEYTGTARELLLGFLFAIAVLVPLYVALFAVSLAPALGVFARLSSVIAFVLLGVLGQYAIYRARRYRLTRTVFRGVRFHQSGSAWRYALYAIIWSVMVLLTLGLAYPFMQSQLERFKMRNTFFGDLPGRFEGSGLRLLLRGLLMWIVVIGPLLASIAYLVAVVDWRASAAIVDQAIGRPTLDVLNQLEAANPDIKAALGFLIGSLLLGGLAALILYPLFQAMLMRWWASGLRFGEVAMHSRLRTKSVYGAYARFIGMTVLWSMGSGTALGMVMGVASTTLTPLNKDAADVALVLLALAGYVVVMLGYSTLYQVLVRLAIWRLVVQSLELAGTVALERVSAEGQPSSAFGEGLADALNVGGL
jgi:uncharacterized membrane protein YjgN (DUF898 family)